MLRLQDILLSHTYYAHENMTYQESHPTFTFGRKERKSAPLFQVMSLVLDDEIPCPQIVPRRLLKIPETSRCCSLTPLEG